MAQVERFEDLDVWQYVRKLANMNYVLTSKKPFDREYGL